MQGVRQQVSVLLALLIFHSVGAFNAYPGSLTSFHSSRIGSLPVTFTHQHQTKSSCRRQKETHLSMAVKSPRTPGFVTDEDAIKIGLYGTAANLVCFYSLYVLRTTGCGLPPGFLGLEGAIEGISYTIAVGIFGWSGLTYIQRGGGLDAGPFGLLGLAEGLTYLTVLGGIVIALLNLLQYGFLPGFLPNDKCFGL